MAAAVEAVALELRLEEMRLAEVREEGPRAGAVGRRSYKSAAARKGRGRP